MSFGEFVILGYLDPGTGSMVLQVLIATLVGSGFAIKLFWNRIVFFFARIFKGGKQVVSEDQKGSITPEADVK